MVGLDQGRDLHDPAGVRRAARRAGRSRHRRSEASTPTTPDAAVEVAYNADLPPETFDLVIVDECHRSIYGVWRGVLEYFDAHIVGLTATPVKQTFGFFQQNLVSEYTYPQSVADDVNVDFDVYRIKTEISRAGLAPSTPGTVVPIRTAAPARSGTRRSTRTSTTPAPQLDRAVIRTGQIRLVLETFRDRLFTEIFPGRTTVPKTLIFAKDDNHAEEIVTIVRGGVRQGQRLRRQDHLQRRGRRGPARRPSAPPRRCASPSPST